jgi:hypothetical protein
VNKIRFSVIALLCGLLLNNYWLLAPLLGVSSAHLVSSLELAGQPHAELFRGLSVAAGVSVGISAVPFLRITSVRRRLLAQLILVLGLCIVIDGVFAINCEPCTLRALNLSGWIHGIESTVYVIGIVVGTLLCAWWERRVAPLFTKVQIGLLALYLALHSLVLLSLNTNGGLFQRVTLVVETLLLFWIWRFAALPPKDKPLILKR